MESSRLAFNRAESDAGQSPRHEPDIIDEFGNSADGAIERGILAHAIAKLFEGMAKHEPGQDQTRPRSIQNRRPGPCRSTR